MDKPNTTNSFIYNASEVMNESESIIHKTNEGEEGGYIYSDEENCASPSA